MCLLQASGIPGTAVQWGAWGGSGGMAERTPGFVKRMERQGLGILQPEVGVSLLARVLASAAAPAVSPALPPVIVGTVPLSGTQNTLDLMPKA